MKTLAFCAAAALSLIASSAQALTYFAQRDVGNGVLELSITTDDTLGILATDNILDWTIVLHQGQISYTLEGIDGADNSTHEIVGTALTATARHLSFDFSALGRAYFLVQAPSVGSGETFWCVQASGCTNSPVLPAEVLLAGPNAAARTFLNQSGNQIIASVREAVLVPEPATWALMISGFGLAGATLRMRRRLAV